MLAHDVEAYVASCAHCALRERERERERGERERESVLRVMIRRPLNHYCDGNVGGR
jgi:hypothetical protein